MDVRIEAAPMVAYVAMTPVVVSTTDVALSQTILVLSELVASFSCPSISGHSISAVAPDAYFEMEELAKAA